MLRFTHIPPRNGEVFHNKTIIKNIHAKFTLTNKIFSLVYSEYLKKQSLMERIFNARCLCLHAVSGPSAVFLLIFSLIFPANLLSQKCKLPPYVSDTSQEFHDGNYRFFLAGSAFLFNKIIRYVGNPCKVPGDEFCFYNCSAFKLENFVSPDFIFSIKRAIYL